MSFSSASRRRTSRFSSVTLRWKDERGIALLTCLSISRMRIGVPPTFAATELGTMGAFIPPAADAGCEPPTSAAQAAATAAAGTLYCILKSSS